MTAAVAQYGLAPPEMEEKVERVQTQLEWAKSLSITTAVEFTDAAETLKGVKALVKEIEQCFDPLKRKASEAHKAIVAEEKRQLAPLVEVERLAKNAMLGYQRVEQEKAETERRRLQAIADEAARKERERLEKLAASAKKPETKEKYAEAAAAVAPAPVVHVAPPVPKVAGITTSETWTGEVVNLAEFYAFVFENKRFELVTPNDKAIQQLARSLKNGAQIPGLRFSPKQVMSARS